MGQNALPGNNNLVIRFIDENYGEKVGDGVCIDLLYGVRGYIDLITNSKDSIMENINIKDIKAGDLLDLHNVVFADGTIAEKHMAFVYRISAGGVITIAEQNVGSLENATKIIRDGEEVLVVKDSHVVFAIFDPAEVVSGKVSFYRL